MNRDDLDPAYDAATALSDMRRASDFFAMQDDDDAQGMASDLNAALAYFGEREPDTGDLIDWRQRALDAESDLNRLTKENA